jgi:CubicO group peptidase (beta-lactamase class C family)
MKFKLSMVSIIILIGLSACTGQSSGVVDLSAELTASPTEFVELTPDAALELTPDLTPTIEPTPNATQIALAWDWGYSTPEEQGMDSDVLADMLEEIKETYPSIKSVTVIRNENVVLDAYAYPYSKNNSYSINSIVKSIMSILFGIAIDQGYIESVDQPLTDFFPAESMDNFDYRKEAITLEHLLTMTPGLDCRDSYMFNWDWSDPQWREIDDWVQYFIDLPMISFPGSRFAYCNSDARVLSVILTRATGMTAQGFANKYLFGPMGLKVNDWNTFQGAYSDGARGIRIKPIDLARVGQLVLNDGVWEGQRIVSEEWLNQSTQPYIEGNLEDNYGYLWWLNESGFYAGIGYGGQYMYVVPWADLVVVFMSSNGTESFNIPPHLLWQYIFKSIVSKEALDSNPEGYQRMLDAIDDLGR